MAHRIDTRLTYTTSQQPVRAPMPLIALAFFMVQRAATYGVYTINSMMCLPYDMAKPCLQQYAYSNWYQVYMRGSVTNCCCCCLSCCCFRCCCCCCWYTYQRYTSGCWYTSGMYTNRYTLSIKNGTQSSMWYQVPYTAVAAAVFARFAVYLWFTYNLIGIYLVQHRTHI